MRVIEERNSLGGIMIVSQAQSRSELLEAYDSVCQATDPYVAYCEVDLDNLTLTIINREIADAKRMG
jgi:hypothetical protein